MLRKEIHTYPKVSDTELAATSRATLECRQAQLQIKQLEHQAAQYMVMLDRL